MSKDGSFTRFVCDRPPAAHSDGKERREYVKDGNTMAANAWHDVSYTDVNGSTANYVLCGECYEAYLEAKRQMDAAMSAFVRGGE